MEMYKPKLEVVFCWGADRLFPKNKKTVLSVEIFKSKALVCFHDVETINFNNRFHAVSPDVVSSSRHCDVTLMIVCLI